MRQNTKDIMYRFERKKTILKYGLSINIDLKDFKLDNVNLDSDNLSVNVKTDTKVNVRELSDISNDKQFKENRFYPPQETEFDIFHFSNLKNGLVITIPKNTKLSSPLQINTKLLSENSIHHIMIIAEENSEATIIDQIHDGTELKGYNSKFVDVIAKKGSKIEYYHTQNISKKKVHYSRKTAITESNAEINWHDFSIGSLITISDLTTILNGEMSRSRIQSILFSSDDQQFDILGQAIHRTRNTFSKVEARGAIKGSSKTLYKGNVHIEEKAFDSEGFQRADLIILDNHSEADAIPQLLIDNNEVKCSHAVAIGRIDEEKLFYLMSRGITELEAKHEIVKGFFESAIKGIKIDSVSDGLRSDIQEKMLE